MFLYQSESLDVSYRTAQNQLVLTSCGDVISSEVKEGFMLALQHARANKVKSWLLDFRQVEQLTDEVEVWIQVQIFPQIMAYLGSDNYVALVVSDSCYQNMMSEYGTDGLHTYNCFIVLDTFSTPEAAIAWLDSHTTVSN